MVHADFKLGLEFYTGAGKWRCTDVGTRTFVAIQIDHVDVVEMDQGVETRKTVTDDPSWFNGPPYAVEEVVFDEYDIEGCSLEPVVEATLHLTSDLTNA